jgi:hypothetical protein
VSGGFHALLARVIASAPPGVTWPALPSYGLLSEWRFGEGSGTTVADSVAGARPINLELPTTPNYTWTARGVSLAAGLVQTPSVPGARTVAMLYKTTRNQTAGFLVSGGAASGHGALEETVSTTNAYWASTSGRGMSPVLYRTSTGAFATALNRGGWVLLIIEYPVAYTTVLGLGGRHSTTTGRCAGFEVAWCGVWDRTLSGAERTQVLDHVRGTFAVPRGIYVHRDDCPTRATVLQINGQSNASGRALRSDLTAPEAARSFAKVYATAGSISTRPSMPPGVLVLGTNQTAENVATQFGLETPFAWAWEDNRAGRVYICKVSLGSTYLAPSSLGSPVVTSNTWNSAEDIAGSIANRAIRDHHDIIQAAAALGIGLDWVWCWMQGEQDATSTTYSAGYQANLQALSDFMDAYLGTPTKRIICRIRDQDPSFSATAVAQVRAAQAAFVAANANSVLIDTDAMTLAVDQAHYNAAGMRSLGAAVYAAMPDEEGGG